MNIFKRKQNHPALTVQEVQAMLTRKLSGALSPHGFKRSGTTFLRNTGELIQIINLQGDKWNQGNEGKYYINLAVYYGKIDTLEYGDEPTNTPKEYDGQLRNSLRGKGIPESWSFSPKTDYEVHSDALVSAVVAHGLPYFKGINTPLQLAECVLDKNKNGMITVASHITQALIFAELGDKVRAQKEFNTYFKENKRLKSDSPISKMTMRHYLCVAERAKLSLHFPILDGETCVGFYIAMKGKRLVGDELKTRKKLEMYLRNLEKKDLGYTHYDRCLRKHGTYRVGFCTKDPEFVARYISEREDKMANPLQQIVANDSF